MLLNSNLFMLLPFQIANRIQELTQKCRQLRTICLLIILSSNISITDTY